MHRTTIQEAVKYLKNNQLKNGGYKNTSFQYPGMPTKKPIEQTSIFTSLIIARALATIRPDTAILKECTCSIARYILNENSGKWSWNYRGIGKNADKLEIKNRAKISKYPDDLDDTFNALISLQLLKPDMVNEEAWAKIANHLIGSETKPGGPYETWINPPEGKIWHDVDVAVNANIGYGLHLAGIKMPKLLDYIKQCIEDNKLQSPYYFGEAPIIYFISCWVKSSNVRDKISLMLKNKNNNSLTLSLLISSGYRQGVPRNTLMEATKKLLDLKQDDHWPAEAFYIDIPIDNKDQYSGSKMLTTALALEALSLMSSENNKEHNGSQVSSVTPNIDSSFPKINQYAKSFPELIRKDYLKVALAIGRDAMGHYILDPVSIAEDAHDIKVPLGIKRNLNKASLNGWVAYTLYDDVLDGDRHPDSICVANAAQRAMQTSFTDADLGSHFEALMLKTLMGIDEANLWEIKKCTTEVRTDFSLSYQIPNYGNLDQLASKSLGHMLAYCGVAFYAQTKKQSTIEDMRHIVEFFKNYIIAKQLNDDAHDWQVDLEKGKLTAINCMLLKDNWPSKVNTRNDMQNLKIHFWSDTITKVNALIQHHISTASSHISKANLAKPEVCLKMLEPLSKSTRTTSTEHAETAQFMKTFESIRKNI